jgi:hypothetical protein
MGRAFPFTARAGTVLAERQRCDWDRFPLGVTEGRCGRVMAHKFTLVSMTTKLLKVRHVASGLRYTFHISEPKAGRQLLVSVPPSKPSTRSVRAVLEKAALTFAEREARKADLID